MARSRTVSFSQNVVLQQAENTNKATLFYQKSFERQLSENYCQAPIRRIERALMKKQKNTVQRKIQLLENLVTLALNQNKENKDAEQTLKLLRTPSKRNFPMENYSSNIQRSLLNTAASQDNTSENSTKNNISVTCPPYNLETVGNDSFLNYFHKLLTKGKYTGDGNLLATPGKVTLPSIMIPRTLLSSPEGNTKTSTSLTKDNELFFSTGPGRKWNHSLMN